MDTIPDTLDALRVPVESLSFYGRNPRTGDVDAIAESLSTNGQYRPLVVNRRTGEVLAGNHTLKAARQLGWGEIAATFVDVDDEQAARIVLVDNRSNDLAVYDDRALVDLLESLPDLTGTGFDQSALDELLAKVTDLPPALEDPDAVPDLPAEPVTVLGDVWLLGPHRVVCGDSTDVGVYDTLLGDELADIVWTDPPYGVSYVGKTKDALTIQNDGEGPLEELLSTTLGALVTYTKPGAAWYVASPSGPSHLVFGQVLKDLQVLRQTLVWLKSAMVLGHSDYHYKHEFIYTGYTPGYAGRRGRGGAGWYGDHAQVSVLEFDKPSASREHPTMKPVALIIKCLENSSTKGQTLIDSFAGSGSSLIAAHQTGRVARVIELDPRYVDVICRRYQEATGDKPILQSTGDPHDFTG